MVQTRVVTYPSSGGRKLEVTELNIVIKNSYTLANGEVSTLLELPLDEFKGLKFILEGFNSTENKYIIKEYTVIAISSEIAENCFNVLNLGNINFQARFFVEDDKLKLEISNTNDFPLTLEVLRIVIGGA